MIDWRIAERVADAVSGDPHGGPDAAALGALVTRCEEAARDYTGLEPTAPIPAPEAVDRPQWTRANLATLRRTFEPATGRIGESMGPLAPPLRAVAGGLLGAQMGALSGLLAQRVLGQYDVALLDPGVPPRLLFVAPNLDEASRSLSADPDDLLAWVTLHEVTHALQFGGVPWLREHLGEMLRELLGGLETRLDASAVMRLPSFDDVRRLVAAVRDEGVIALVTDPGQRAVIDRLQATMTVIEGHAEHVMDAAGGDLVPSRDALRAGLEHRRESLPPLFRVVMRVLGLDVKLRQYAVGKRFCDAVAQSGGPQALGQLWEAPAALPTPDELEHPERWLTRA